MDILEKIMERAKANPQRIVLPEGTEPRTLQAADIILQEKAARLILIGNEAEIHRLAEEKGLAHLGEATIFDPDTNPKMAEYANLLYELRKNKGMTPDEDGMQVVEAEVPMAEMQDFTTFLRQLTQGRGWFTFDFVRYEQLPQMLESKVIEQAKALGNLNDDEG